MSMMIDKKVNEGTLKDFSSSYILLNSVFEILPLVFFMYSIFHLICFLMIRDYEEVKDPLDDTKTLYY